VIHPDDAGQRDIGDGQRVRVFNDRGTLVASAVVSEDVRPGVVLTNMGHWRKLSLAESTVNAINAPAFADLGNAPTFSDTLVQVEPVS
jgi:anaerobic selenocysteine-containing dehydrogenase